MTANSDRQILASLQFRRGESADDRIREVGGDELVAEIVRMEVVLSPLLGVGVDQNRHDRTGGGLIASTRWIRASGSF